MLWLLLAICLVTVLSPVPNGALQGRQDFAWFGWATMLNGLGRFLVLSIVVWGLGWGALGGLAGVLVGSSVVLVLVTWRTWDGLTGPGAGFDVRAWLRRVVPVTLGLGALIVIMQADALVVRDKLQPMLSDNEIDGYSAVRKIGQAMVFLVGALVSVMYPKVARSFQRAEATDALRLSLVLTVVVGVGGAGLASLFPQIPLLISPARLMASKTLVPIYCWALVPLALANVLVWSLLARECFRAVPWLIAVAAGYWFALQRFHDRLETVVRVLGVFATLLVVVCGVFAWLDRRKRQAGNKAETESAAT
jgi:O-antigen/teichoic acid export membrane protein